MITTTLVVGVLYVNAYVRRVRTPAPQGFDVVIPARKEGT
jgi:hypothetical protein